MAELNTIITLRQGTTAEWNSSSVVLKQGEMGLEYLENGSVKMKAGDGEHLWSALSYIGSDVKAANVFQVELEANDLDDIAAIEAQVALENAEKQDGDIAVVKAAIADGKYSYTSYVYEAALDIESENSSHGWSAMDGNYSASNVFLKNKIELAGSFSSVGNYNKGKTIAAGTSLEALLSGMLQQELYPNANDKPNASISVSGGSGEVGSEYTVPTATLTIDDVGSYLYGDKATGITFAIGDVKLCEGADPASATNYKTNDAVMAKGSTLKLKASGDKVRYADTAATYTFSATASYPAGKVPVTNLGNEYPAAQIPAGSVTIDDKTATFSGYRYAFAGGSTAATIDSAVVRSMTAKKSSKASMDSESEALEFTASAGATKVFFAYPATWTGTPYFEMFGLAWAANNDIVAKDNIQVADARGTVDGALQGAVAYKLYCWELDTPLQAETTKFRVWFK